MLHFIKVPCKHCPFRKDVRPYLHPRRAEEIAYATQNSYNSFSCHKTTEYDENDEKGRMLVTEESKECAGFLTLRAAQGEEVPYGFVPSYDLVYEDIPQMIEAYEGQWSRKNK